MCFVAGDRRVYWAHTTRIHRKEPVYDNVRTQANSVTVGDRSVHRRGLGVAVPRRRERVDTGLAGHEVRAFRALGSGQPQGHRDRLVARARGARRRVRPALQAFQSDVVRRRSVGHHRQRGRHALPRPDVQTPRRVLPVAVEVHRLPHRQHALRAGRDARAGRRLRRARHPVLHIPLDLRLVPSGLSNGQSRRQHEEAEPQHAALLPVPAEPDAGDHRALRAAGHHVVRRASSRIW